MKRPIGILGGSFDPIHFGHLRLATECIQAIGLDKVLLVPLNIPAHRNPLVADSSQRWKMLSLAVKKNSQLEISDVEIKRNEVSYTVDTLKIFRDIYTEQPLCLITGMDAFITFDSWKQWENLTDLAHIIITNRPDSSCEIKNASLKTLLESSLTTNQQDLAKTPAGKIMMIDIPQLEISSSRIRELLVQGKSIDYLLPDPVIDYITTNNIYTGTTK